MSDTKVEVDMNRDAPCRVALEMTYHLMHHIEDATDRKAAFLDLYAECIVAANGFRTLNKGAAGNPARI